MGRFRSGAPPPDQRGSLEDRVSNPFRFLLLSLLIIALVVALITTVAFLLLTRPPAITATNAVWLGIDWGAESHPDEQIRRLTLELQANGVDTVYVWLSWLQEDGTWSETTFEHISIFTAQFRRYYPQARLLAWIGLPVEVPAYRLDDAAVRAEVAAFCGRAITEFSFDGVHLNAEPVWNGDANFPALLREIRQSIGPDAPLSVTVFPDYNTGTPGIPASPLTTPDFFFSPEYKQSIALLADEVVVMAYNSGLSTAADYETWMAFQVTQFVSAIAALGGDIETHLIFGIPTYDAEPPGHDPAVESIPAALAGIRRGLEQVGAENALLVRGVSVYAYWSTDAMEWKQYRQLWLGAPSD